MYKTIITNKKQIGLQFHKAQSSSINPTWWNIIFLFFLYNIEAFLLAICTTSVLSVCRAWQHQTPPPLKPVAFKGGLYSDAAEKLVILHKLVCNSMLFFAAVKTCHYSTYSLWIQTDHTCSTRGIFSCFLFI